MTTRIFRAVLLYSLSFSCAFAKSLPCDISQQQIGVFRPDYMTTADEQRAGIRVLEGDILQDSNYVGPTNSPTMVEDAVSVTIKLWPDGRIPYKLDDMFTHAQKEIIKMAMGVFEHNTCIKWESTSDNNISYVLIRLGDCCCSELGYEEASIQNVKLHPLCFEHLGIVIHELMHATGFFHEQSRIDRDDWVKVDYDNVIDDKRSQFQKYSTSIDARLIRKRYDYGSIMHYEEGAFAKQAGFKTINALRPLINIAKLGQRAYLSPLDVEKINILYDCSGVTEKCHEQQIVCAAGDSVNCGIPCNGIAECSDGRDESPKHCPPTCRDPNMFACKILSCIPKSWLCDGLKDCVGGEDEAPENCYQRKCNKTQNEFDCGSKCIPLYYVCDGISDCIQSQDEEPNMCAQRKQHQLKLWEGDYEHFASHEPWPFGYHLIFHTTDDTDTLEPRTTLLPSTIPTHCFINAVGFDFRPEIRLTPEILQTLLSGSDDSNTRACRFITLGFARVDADALNISFADSADAQRTLELMPAAVDDHRIGLFLIAIGGTGPNIEDLSTIGNNVTQARQFARNVIQQLRVWKAGGLVLEWLRPTSTGVDRTAFITLVKTLAEAVQFDPVLLKKPASMSQRSYNNNGEKPNTRASSASSPPTPPPPPRRLILGMNVLNIIQPGLDQPFLLKNIDFFNIMPDPAELLPSPHTFYTNRLFMNVTNNKFVGEGSQQLNNTTWLSTADNVTMLRFNIGIRLSPLTWTFAQKPNAPPRVGSNTSSRGLPGPFTGTSGMLNYGEVCILEDSKQLNGYRAWTALERRADSRQLKSAYAYSLPELQWISYESPESLGAKLTKSKLAGRVMGVYVVDVHNDDVRGFCDVKDRKLFPLMNAIANSAASSG